MLQLDDRPRVGRYILTRPLADSHLGERHLALAEEDSTSHVLHVIDLSLVVPDTTGPGLRLSATQTVAGRFEAAAARASRLEHPHILGIESYEIDELGHGNIVTPFTGDSTGIVTLGRHLRAKGGYLSPLETFEAIGHLLSACDHAHRVGHRHGPMGMDEVLVDRRGSLLIELYGVARLLRAGDEAAADVERAEVRSIVRIGYQLVTGLLPETPLIAAGRVVPNLDPVWDDWFDTGLRSGPGFKSAAHALSALADRRRELPMTRRLGRMRAALGRLLTPGSR